MIPAAVVALTMARADKIVAREAGKDAAEIAALDRTAEALFSEVAPLGWRAAEPLGQAAQDPKRAPKARLFAVMYLSKLHDPAALRPLSDVLLGREEDPDVLSAAAGGLSVLDVSPQAARRPLCAALARPALPRSVVDDVLVPLTHLGCDAPAALEKLARGFGPRPQGPDLVTVERALAALGRSRGSAGAKSLLSLTAYFPAGGAARAAAIAALDARRDDLATALAAEALPVLREALGTQNDDPASMARLVHVLDAFGPDADALLLPLASHSDAEVLAAAAEALARRKALAALPPLEAAAAGALNDPRFAPKPGRPDPAVLLSRVEASVDTLRRAKAARQ